MTTAEPWWARVQQPHVARRTNRANTVRQLRTIVLPSYQTWCTARRAAQRFGAPLASPIARKQGVGSIQIRPPDRAGVRAGLLFGRRAWSRPRSWRRPRQPRKTTRRPELGKVPAKRSGVCSGAGNSLNHTVLRACTPSGRLAGTESRTGDHWCSFQRTARYPLLWDIHSMVRPRVQRHADEKPSILGDAAAFGCANWWHAHSIGRRPAFVWTAPAPAQR